MSWWQVNCHPKYFRSRTIRLLNSCYPRGSAPLDAPVGSELSLLTYYVSSKPAKLSKVFPFIEQRIQKSLKRQRFDYVRVNVKIVDAIIQACFAHINVCTKYVIRIIILLLQSNHEEFIAMGTDTFIKYCAIETSYTSTSATRLHSSLFYELFEIYCQLCVIKQDGVAIVDRYYGLKGLRAIIMIESVSSTPQTASHMDLIIAAIAANLQSHLLRRRLPSSRIDHAEGSHEILLTGTDTSIIQAERLPSEKVGEEEKSTLPQLAHSSNDNHRNASKSFPPQTRFKADQFHTPVDTMRNDLSTLQPPVVSATLNEVSTFDSSAASSISSSPERFRQRGDSVFYPENDAMRRPGNVPVSFSSDADSWPRIREIISLETLDDIASNCLRDLVHGANAISMKLIVQSFLAYMDSTNAWCSELPLTSMSIIMDSFQAQYAYLLVAQLITHIDNHVTNSPAAIKNQMVGVLAYVLSVEKGSVGLSVLELLHALLRYLIASVVKADEQPDVSEQEKDFQASIINTIDGMTRNLQLFYQRNDCMLFIIGQLRTISAFAKELPPVGEQPSQSRRRRMSEWSAMRDRAKQLRSEIIRRDPFANFPAIAFIKEHVFEKDREKQARPQSSNRGEESTPPEWVSSHTFKLAITEIQLPFVRRAFMKCVLTLAQAHTPPALLNRMYSQSFVQLLLAYMTDPDLELRTLVHAVIHEMLVETTGDIYRAGSIDSMVSQENYYNGYDSTRLTRCHPDYYFKLQYGSLLHKRLNDHILFHEDLPGDFVAIFSTIYWLLTQYCEHELVRSIPLLLSAQSDFRQEVKSLIALLPIQETVSKQLQTQLSRQRAFYQLFIEYLILASKQINNPNLENFANGLKLSLVEAGSWNASTFSDMPFQSENPDCRSWSTLEEEYFRDTGARLIIVPSDFFVSPDMLYNVLRDNAELAALLSDAEITASRGDISTISASDLAASVTSSSELLSTRAEGRLSEEFVADTDNQPSEIGIIKDHHFADGASEQYLLAGSIKSPPPPTPFLTVEDFRNALLENDASFMYDRVDHVSDDCII